MKRKSSKRSILNKNTKRVSHSLAPIIDLTTISPTQVDLGIGTAHLDSHTPCLKANLTLKSQKALRRDLLRCSDQRPSLLGSHTLQPPRIHPGSQQVHTATSSSVDHQHSLRRHSLSMNSRTFYATIDRIGPWPDISISRLRSDGNELLRPLKNFRNLKNPRVFSPKYYAGLNETTSKFKFYSSTRSYIDEYRKQKGYLVGTHKLSQANSLLSSTPLSIQQSDDDQLSGMGTFSSAVAVDLNNSIIKEDKTIISTRELSIPNNGLTKSTNDSLEFTSTPPSIPSVTKIFNDPHQVNNFPTITMRNGHLRPTRHPPHHTIVAQQSQQQAIALPSLTGSSLHYISSMSSIEKAYSNSKKTSAQNQSKLFFIDRRQRKRITQRFNSDSEISRSQDHSDLQATGASLGTIPQRSTAVVVYQLPRRPPPISTSQNDIGSLS
ncbi:unnamed protein product [Rotaria sp. Silwood2]|nr:unnamed protein product [Rotaria sp. Silwood2]CAF2860417.1 unnamed protein product [Rotaria sp. Silwood2]CAF3292514.1 unnamed protein product [Rotaria sp. Silwood2]CAF4195340.1 unnamed protein product [Rotaria sp. Silwood2]CAF4206131.1 unnamed protein product [Rotaria sp. Silwood2]